MTFELDRHKGQAKRADPVTLAFAMADLPAPRAPSQSVLDLLPISRRRIQALARLGSTERSPIAFQILGRILLHAALVGVAAGLFGSVFVAALDLAQRGVLEVLAGYLPLRAAGEHF